MKTTLNADASCRHHWVLGQPQAGRISARCKLCGSLRSYPAVLDDLDPGVDAPGGAPESVATAAGGARPSASALQREVALLVEAESS
jgi:hypothetical protein